MAGNKWRGGRVAWDLSSLPGVLLSSPGIKPLPAVLDPNVGTEVVLLITEPEGAVCDFQGRNITSFFMKSGLVNTSYGPVYWLLFYFPTPVTGQTTTYEIVVNPTDPVQLSNFTQLAAQEYWHVVIASTSGVSINFFEFPNNYGLEDALDQVRTACAGRKTSNFPAAKAEYQARFSVEQLLQA